MWSVPWLYIITENCVNRIEYIYIYIIVFLCVYTCKIIRSCMQKAGLIWFWNVLFDYLLGSWSRSGGRCYSCRGVAVAHKLQSSPRFCKLCYRRVYIMSDYVRNPILEFTACTLYTFRRKWNWTLHGKYNGKMKDQQMTTDDTWHIS